MHDEQLFLIQKMTAWYPLTVEKFDKRLRGLRSEMVPEKGGDGSRADKIWNAVERSLELCRGCVGLDHCKQVEFPGTMTQGYHHMPFVAFYLTHGLMRCKWGLLQDEADSKPWLEKRQSEKTFAGFRVTSENQSAFRGCQNYLRNAEKNLESGRSITLSGSTGVGKTHLASALFREVMIKKPCTGSFLFMPDYIAEIKSRFGEKGGGGTEQYIDQTMSSKFIVLDNFEFRLVTDWLADILFRIVDLRYRLSLPTIVTTGWGAERMAEILEDKVPSRLIEMGQWFPVRGEDWRRKKKKRSRSEEMKNG